MSVDIGNAITAADKVGNWWLLHGDGSMDVSSALDMAPVAFGVPPTSPLQLGSGKSFVSGTTKAFPTGNFSWVVSFNVSSFSNYSVLLSKWDGATNPFTVQIIQTTGQLGFYVNGGGGGRNVVTAGAVPLGSFAVAAGSYDASTGTVKVRISGVNTSNAAGAAAVGSISYQHEVGRQTLVNFNTVPWQSYGAFFTEKLLSDADFDRIGAMSTALTPASFLRINGIDVPTLDGTASEATEEQGKSDRASDATMRITRRALKRKWTATIGHHTPGDFAAWKGLVLGKGHTVSFEGPGGTAQLYSTKGLPPNTVGAGASAENVPVNAKFGNGNLLLTSGFNISYQFFGATQPQGWTIAAWVASPTTYHHYVGRSDGSWWLDGAGSSVPTWFSSLTAGNLTLTAPSTIRVDDLLALPFAVPDLWPAQMYAFGVAGNPVSDMARLKIDGRLVENNSEVVVVKGDVSNAKVIQAYLNGVWYSNLHVLDVAFEEV